MRKICAFDTQILIWGIRDRGDPATQEMANRFDFLVSELDSEGTQLVVPAICLAELLSPMSENHSEKFAAEVAAKFSVAPFDLHASQIAAQLFRNPAIKKVARKGAPGSRITFRADTLIVATAKAAGASVFYSQDENCRSIAATLMDARALPNFDERLIR